MDSEELRFVVLGKTGVGKSSSINTIVGKDVCRVTVSSSSVTKQCQLVEDDVLGKHLVIVDTLGLYDTESTEEETRKEIGKIIGLTSPGFHAFVVVIRIGRFTREEIQSVYILADMFGPELYERTVLLFTCIDHLEADELTFPAYLRNNINKDLKDLITKCGGRVVGFNNRVRGDTRQIDELMSKLSTVDIAKHGSYYTNQMYRDAKQILDEEENRRLEKDRTKCRSGVRQEIRYDIAEETSFGKKILNVLIDKIAVPAAEALVNAGKKAIGKLTIEACDKDFPIKKFCDKFTLLINVDSNLAPPQINFPGFLDNYLKIYVIREIRLTTFNEHHSDILGPDITRAITGPLCIWFYILHRYEIKI